MASAWASGPPKPVATLTDADLPLGATLRAVLVTGDEVAGEVAAFDQSADAVVIKVPGAKADSFTLRIVALRALKARQTKHLATFARSLARPAPPAAAPSLSPSWRRRRCSRSRRRPRTTSPRHASPPRHCRTVSAQHARPRLPSRRRPCPRCRRSAWRSASRRAP